MKLAEYYLNENFFIKLIEFPALYNIKTDELYSLNEKGLEIIQNIEEGKTLNIKDKEEKEFINYCLNEGILTTEPQKRIKTLLRQSPIPSLRYLELQITNNVILDVNTVLLIEIQYIISGLKKFKKSLKNLNRCRD